MATFYLAGQTMVEVYGDPIDLSSGGKALAAISPNTEDAAQEKHVPVPTYDEVKKEVRVSVGSVAHPMTEEHLIDWIMLVTKRGVQRVNLTAADAPEAVFLLADGDAPVKVLAYCNLHGLWQADV